MCGIAGIVTFHASVPVNRDRLIPMADAIAHRGPDAAGYWSAPGVGLAHRRLSIIDLAGGDQPIGNEDGSVQVVFNGEIYNYRELRTDLETRGHQFRTHSDTEVLVHLYEEMGERLVDRLRGMFALALWDTSRRRLVLARDRVGQKPLYYYRDNEKLLFGSEIKAILAAPGVPRDIDPVALDDYLTFGVVPGERSIFRGIRKLPPAHVLVVEPGQWNSSPRKYWSLNLEPDPVRSVDDWIEALSAKFDETVNSHRIADVPIGAFLSGGVDSSAVVASLAASGGEPVRTFSIGFQEESFNELPYARIVAEQFGTRHVEEIVTADAARGLNDLVHFYDEPFADSSAIPTMAVCRAARKHVKVVLSGDGGDEAFGGYSRYANDLREAKFRAILPSWLRRTLLHQVAAIWPKTDWLPRPLRLKTALTNLSLDSAQAYANTISLCRPETRNRLLQPDVRRQLKGHRPEEQIEQSYGRPTNDVLRGMIAADVSMLLPDDFLTKVDRASMAVGLEVRPPLVDHQFLELAARVPSQWKIHRGTTKWIFKEFVKTRLPDGILNRPKRGFEIPVDRWFATSLQEPFRASVLSSGHRIAEFIDQKTAERLFRSHCQGTGHHGNTLWSLLVLGRWLERYLPEK